MEHPPFFQRPKGVLLRVAILRLLIKRPMHGYEIMKHVEQATGGMWGPSHSMLYKTLSDLAAKGYISSQKDFKGEVERIVYSLTNEGEKQYKQEITQIVRMISNIIDYTEAQPLFQPAMMLDHLSPDEQKKFFLGKNQCLYPGIAFIVNGLNDCQLILFGPRTRGPTDLCHADCSGIIFSAG